MRRYTLILTAFVLSLSLVADAAFAQRGGRGGGGGGRAGGGAGPSANRSPSMSRPSAPSASRPSGTAAALSAGQPSTRPSTPSRPVGGATVNTSLDSEPTFGRATVNTSLDTKPSLGGATVNTSLDSRSSVGWTTSFDRHASLNAECGHASEHRPRQDPEWDWRRCRTEARHARLVQARCLAVAQHAPRTTNRQPTSRPTRR